MQTKPAKCFCLAENWPLSIRLGYSVFPHNLPPTSQGCSGTAHIAGNPACRLQRPAVHTRPASLSASSATASLSVVLRPSSHSHRSNSLIFMAQEKLERVTEVCEERRRPRRRGPLRQIFRHRSGQPQGRRHLKPEGGLAPQLGADWLFSASTEATRMCPGSCVGKSARRGLGALWGAEGWADGSGLGGLLRGRAEEAEAE